MILRTVHLRQWYLTNAVSLYCKVAYCDEYVCLSVCLSLCLSVRLHTVTRKAHGRSSPTSVFVDDVMFSHNSSGLCRAIKRRKHNSRDSNQILLSNKDQQILIVTCVPAAKSAIYHCRFVFRFLRATYMHSACMLWPTIYPSIRQ